MALSSACGKAPRGDVSSGARKHLHRDCRCSGQEDWPARPPRDVCPTRRSSALDETWRRVSSIPPHHPRSVRARRRFGRQTGRRVCPVCPFQELRYMPLIHQVAQPAAAVSAFVRHEARACVAQTVSSSLPFPANHHIKGTAAAIRLARLRYRKDLAGQGLGLQPERHQPPQHTFSLTSLAGDHQHTAYAGPHRLIDKTRQPPFCLRSRQPVQIETPLDRNLALCKPPSRRERSRT